MKKSLISIIKIFLKYSTIMLFVIFFQSCPEGDDNFDYAVFNYSQNDISVLFINLQKNDTLKKFILEPETHYYFSRGNELFWERLSDTLIYGHKLIITQNEKHYNKDYRMILTYNNQLYVRDGDF